MSTFGFDELYEATETGIVQGIPEGVYDVVVEDVRAKADPSRLLFLDLKILNGPAEGKTAQVNLYIPEPTNRNAMFHYRKKIAGFMGDRLKAAFAQASGASDLDTAFDFIADALKGQSVTATIGLRGGDAGQYEGTNELQDTKALSGIPQAAAPAAPAPAAPAPVEETIPVGTNSAGSGDISESVPF